MRKLFFLVAVATAVAIPLSAETRLNVAIDFAHAATSGYGFSESLGWRGFEGEIESLSHYKWVPDFAVGIRREDRAIYHGTFIFARFSKKATTWHKVDIRPSLGIYYGLPSMRFTRTKWNDDRTAYVRIFLSHNITIPFREYHSGVLYPKVAVELRKNWKRFNFGLEPGVQILRFGIVRSNGDGTSDFQTKTVLAPVIGLRIGFRP